jgi:hypothetical protein
MCAEFVQKHGMVVEGNLEGFLMYPKGVRYTI